MALFICVHDQHLHRGPGQKLSGVETVPSEPWLPETLRTRARSRVRGVGDSVNLRIIFWNTWLLRPRLWPNGPPIPGSGRLFAPAVVDRAPLVGRALAGRFDVCALAECFEPQEQEAVTWAWERPQTALGPGRKFPRWTGSGLITVADPTRPAGVEIATSIPHRFGAGGDLRDSDTFANKGALLTRLRAGGPDGPGIDLVSTHLFAGGDLLPIPGAEDHIRHHDVRLRQVAELVSFINEYRDRSLPLLLMGDFNIRHHDTRPGFSDPRATYSDLTSALEPLGVRELWPTHGTGPGHTCTFADAAELPPADDEPDAVRDEAGDEPPGRTSERIDMAWLAGPDPTIGTPTTPTPKVTELRRWSFPDRGVTGGPAGSLSDHLGLSVGLALPTLQR